MCGNIRFCFALLNDHGDRTNQLHWLKCLHTLYISLLNPAGKGRLFYSVNKCFETGADPCNIFDKQILKGWMPCLSTFYCMISRVTLAQSLKACAIARFSKSGCTDEKLWGATLSDPLKWKMPPKSNLKGQIDPQQRSQLKFCNRHIMYFLHEVKNAVKESRVVALS